MASFTQMAAETEIKAAIKLQAILRRKLAANEYYRRKGKCLRPFSIRILSAEQLYTKGATKNTTLSVLLSVVKKPVGPLKYELLVETAVKIDKEIEIEETFFLPGISSDFDIIVTLLATSKTNQDAAMKISPRTPRECIGQGRFSLDPRQMDRIHCRQLVLEKHNFSTNLDVSGTSRPCSGALYVEVEPVGSIKNTFCGNLIAGKSENHGQILHQLDEVIEELQKVKSADISPTSVTDASLAASRKVPSLKRTLSKRLPSRFGKLLDNIKAVQTAPPQRMPFALSGDRLWCCLTPTSLLCYRKFDEVSPALSIQLNSRSVILGSQAAEEKTEGLRSVTRVMYLLHINSEGKWFTFATASSKEREAWLVAVDANIQACS